MMRFHTDIETFSKIDLTKRGLDNYAKHESTEITMGAWAWDNEVVRQTDDVEHYLDTVRVAASMPEVIFHAFNAPFEMVLLREVADINIPPERWRCTMFHAFTLGFSGDLGAIGAQLGLPVTKQKMAEGRRLMLKFSKPAGKTHTVDRWTKENAPEQWEEFCRYNEQDVVAEREISMLLSRYPVPEREQELWCLDQRVNERGLPIDRHLVEKALQIFHDEKRHLTRQLKMLTGLANPNSVQQLAGWFKDANYPMLDFSAERVRDSIRHLEQKPPWEYSKIVLQVLKLRQQVARTAGTKWKAFLDRTDWDTGRLRHSFQIFGAQRTGRWAGRGIQPHNLHRTPVDIDNRVAALLTGSNDWVRLVYGNVMDVVASCIRTAITAPPGKKLVVCDLGSIESRDLGWASGCQRMNQIFAENKDTYKDFASSYFNKPYDEITKEERAFCKPPVLGCGYRLGAKGLVKYAEGMGVDLTGKEAKAAVKLFRKEYPEIPLMWKWLDNALIECVQQGIPQESYSIRLRRDDQFLFLDLPVGRTLSYYQPLVEPKVIKIPDPETGEEREWRTTVVTYMGMDSFSHQWKRLSTHGGKITENFDQAESRDILTIGMQGADSDPILELVGHVHDELICLADETVADTALTRLKTHMLKVPSWAPGLLLDAEGYTAKRYRKD